MMNVRTATAFPAESGWTQEQADKAAEMLPNMMQIDEWLFSPCRLSKDDYERAERWLEKHGASPLESVVGLFGWIIGAVVRVEPRGPKGDGMTVALSDVMVITDDYRSYPVLLPETAIHVLDRLMFNRDLHGIARAPFATFPRMDVKCGAIARVACGFARP